jgi:hypothetical protein
VKRGTAAKTAEKMDGLEKKHPAAISIAAGRLMQAKIFR